MCEMWVGDSSRNIGDSVGHAFGNDDGRQCLGIQVMNSCTENSS